MPERGSRFSRQSDKLGETELSQGVNDIESHSRKTWGEKEGDMYQRAVGVWETNDKERSQMLQAQGLASGTVARKEAQELF